MRRVVTMYCWDTRWMVFATVDVHVSTVAKSDVHGRSFDVNCDQYLLYEPRGCCLFLLWSTDILKQHEHCSSLRIQNQSVFCISSQPFYCMVETIHRKTHVVLVGICFMIHG